MNCRQSKKLFGAYWDDELTQAEREWLEAHFAACDDCRAAYEQLARSIELVGSLPRLDVGPGLAERALARARRTAPVPDRIPATTPRWIPLTATAALLAIACTMVLQWSGLPQRVRNPSPPPLAAVQEPVLVQPPTGSRSVVRPTVTNSMVSDDGSESGTLVASVQDSLFDHSEDVEFILDPVTLRKGRPHTMSRLKPDRVQGQQAVITF